MLIQMIFGGHNWSKITPGSGLFIPRSGHAAVVYNDAMWVIGGLGNGRQNDVWRSSDGSN